MMSLEEHERPVPRVWDRKECRERHGRERSLRARRGYGRTGLTLRQGWLDGRILGVVGVAGGGGGALRTGGTCGEPDRAGADPGDSEPACGDGRCTTSGSTGRRSARSDANPSCPYRRRFPGAGGGRLHDSSRERAGPDPRRALCPTDRPGRKPRRPPLLARPRGAPTGTRHGHSTAAGVSGPGATDWNAVGAGRRRDHDRFRRRVLPEVCL
jgi:hypothetical protein